MKMKTSFLAIKRLFANNKGRRSRNRNANNNNNNNNRQKDADDYPVDNDEVGSVQTDATTTIKDGNSDIQDVADEQELLLQQQQQQQQKHSNNTRQRRVRFALSQNKIYRRNDLQWPADDLDVDARQTTWYSRDDYKGFKKATDAQFSALLLDAVSGNTNNNQNTGGSTVSRLIRAHTGVSSRRTVGCGDKVDDESDIVDHVLKMEKQPQQPQPQPQHSSSSSSSRTSSLGLERALMQECFMVDRTQQQARSLRLIRAIMMQQEELATVIDSDNDEAQLLCVLQKRLRDSSRTQRLFAHYIAKSLEADLSC